MRITFKSPFETSSSIVRRQTPKTSAASARLINFCVCVADMKRGACQTAATRTVEAKRRHWRRGQVDCTMNHRSTAALAMLAGQTVEFYAATLAGQPVELQA